MVRLSPWRPSWLSWSSWSKTSRTRSVPWRPTSWRTRRRFRKWSTASTWAREGEAHMFPKLEVLLSLKIKRKIERHHSLSSVFWENEAFCVLPPRGRALKTQAHPCVEGHVLSPSSSGVLPAVRTCSLCLRAASRAQGRARSHQQVSGGGTRGSCVLGFRF